MGFNQITNKTSTTMFILYTEDYYDYECLERRATIFEDREKAHEEFKKLIKKVKSDLEKHGNDDWEIEETKHSWQAYPDGEWGTTHYLIRIAEIQPNKSINLDYPNHY